MTVSLRPEILKRYKDIASLLVKHGRAGLQAAGDPTVDLTDDATRSMQRDAEALAAELEALGPTFVKLGQLLSTRSDFLPPAYIEALSRLQDDVDPIPTEEIVAAVERELGFRLAKGFASFDLDPLASASLGQVHRATMRDGRPVVVKVQRPAIRERVLTDLEAIDQLAAFADRHTEMGRRLGMAAMVQEFRRSMLDELDYRVEAANLIRLARNLEEFEDIVVPLPVDDYTTTTVLTMDDVGGKKITDVGPLGRLELDGPRLAGALFAAYLKQILQDGFFHADPHPGNVHLTTDGRIALIDLGMVARVPNAMQDHLAKLLLAIGEGNGAEAAELALELGERREDVPVDEEGYRRQVTALIIRQEGLSMDRLAPGTVIAELTRIAGEAGLRPVPELTMLGKALLNLDEVARQLAPDFSPTETIRDRANAILRHRLLTSVSPSQLFGAALEARDFAQRLPGRVNKVIDALAAGELTLNVNGIDESEIMRGVQRLANRVTTGLVLAALIIGAAMLMRVPTSSTLFGYPAIAIVLFLAAAAGGFLLVFSIIWGDHRRSR